VQSAPYAPNVDEDGEEKVDDAERAELRAQLDRVAAFEAAIRPTLLNRFFQKIGPTKPFVAVYRRLGPRIDPWLTKRTGGNINKLYGFPALLLESTGAKSGQRRESPLLYARDGDDFVIVGTNFGTEKHPAWTGNLMKHPEAAVVVGEERVPVVAELVEDDTTFDRLFPKLARVYPGYDRYLERLDGIRRPRLFLLHPTAR
jgi:deazaflavin-dependent oxidoreductase (nitroreductase family)